MEQNRFDKATLDSDGPDCMAPLQLDTIQVNIGLRCNLACHHCHVASSPRRTEEMSWEILQQILDAARQVSCKLVDITGGAPEMNPHFRRFVSALRQQGQQVQVRTNLTIHLEKDEGMEGMLEFFRDNQVQLVASLPCYTEENVDGQRGEGVYHDSVIVLQKLNELGYGIDPELTLNLVYNPGGPSLPPDQANLEVEYHKQLRERFGIEFHKLFAITNVPIGRFIRDLRIQNKAEQYQQLLENSFNHATLDGLMCRNQISIDWDGNLYDCDFNLALKKTVNHGSPTHISDFNAQALLKRRIFTGNHCFACTAGAGSSCGGALT